MTVTVTHPSSTDVAMVGRLIGDVELRATVTMALEPPDAAAEAARRPYARLARMRRCAARHERRRDACPSVVALSGSVDLATVPQLADGLYRLVGDHAGRRVAVDLDGVDVLDDTGLGVLLGAAGRARQAAVSSWSSCPTSVCGPLRTTGFDRAIDVADRLSAVITPLTQRPDRRGPLRTRTTCQDGPENWPPSFASVVFTMAGALSSA